MFSSPSYSVSKHNVLKDKQLMWVLPTFTMLAIQVTLYLWMASRGFEFTDEPYYFHNYLYWKEFTGTVTFFGAYFEWPFRLINESIQGIRMFSLFVVLISSAALMRQVLIFLRNDGPATETAFSRVALVGPMAAGMLYFSYLSTLRAPSYNLLTLCAMVIATICLLRAITQLEKQRSFRSSIVFYGIAVGACFFSKATTTLLLLTAHCVFFFFVSRSWNLKSILAIFGWALLGFLINPLLLTVQFPNWLDSLREGIQVMQMRGDYSAFAVFRHASWELQRIIISAGPWTILVGTAVFLARRKLAGASSSQLSILTILVLATNAVGIILNNKDEFWLFLTLATAVLLWVIEVLKRPHTERTAHDRKELSVAILLFVLPLAFSFGTNMPIFSHSIIASVFPYCFLFHRLYRLSSTGILSRPALAVGSCLLCLPALFYQLAALADVNYTYRQQTSLLNQESPMMVGRSESQLLVDPVTQASLRSVLSAAEKAGFKQGQSFLDFSGDGPGIIFALGAKPLGAPWIIGGYPGSASSAERVIAKVEKSALEQTWLLTSTNNPRKIDGWETILARRLGTGSHQIAASITIASPYIWTPNMPKEITLQLWKPARQPTSEILAHE